MWFSHRHVFIEFSTVSFCMSAATVNSSSSSENRCMMGDGVVMSVNRQTSSVFAASSPLWTRDVLNVFYHLIAQLCFCSSQPRIQGNTPVLVLLRPVPTQEVVSFMADVSVFMQETRVCTSSAKYNLHFTWTNSNLSLVSIATIFPQTWKDHSACFSLHYSTFDWSHTNIHSEQCAAAVYYIV